MSPGGSNCCGQSIAFIEHLLNTSPRQPEGLERGGVATGEDSSLLLRHPDSLQLPKATEEVCNDPRSLGTRLATPCRDPRWPRSVSDLLLEASQRWGVGGRFRSLTVELGSVPLLSLQKPPASILPVCCSLAGVPRGGLSTGPRDGPPAPPSHLPVSPPLLPWAETFPRPGWRY